MRTQRMVEERQGFSGGGGVDVDAKSTAHALVAEVYRQ